MASYSWTPLYMIAMNSPAVTLRSNVMVAQWSMVKRFQEIAEPKTDSELTERRDIGTCMGDLHTVLQALKNRTKT